MNKVYIVFNCYTEINLMTKNDNNFLIINNCSTDKRYYDFPNKQIIYLDKKYNKNSIIEYLNNKNIKYDKLYFFEDNDNENFSFHSIFKFNTSKYNFINIIKKIYNDKYEYNDELENLHYLINEKFIKNDLSYFNELTLIGINDRKSVFIRDFYNYIDINNEFIELYKNFIIEYIKPFYPDEKYILYQKYPNIRIGFPNLTAIGKRDSDPNNEIVGLHNDNEFGHSIQEINYVIPITKMYDTNSIYFENIVYSNQEYDNYNNMKLDTDEFFRGYLNKLNHYNKINKTNKTRISLDFRIIPYSKYMESENKSVTSSKKLSLGDYFSLI